MTLTRQQTRDFIESIKLYEDDVIIVLNKPAGLLTVEGKTADLKDCLLNRLLRYNHHALLVHRLDRDTSGVIVFAKYHEVQVNLSKQFEDKLTQKIYQALVMGHGLDKQGVIDIPVRYEPLTPPLHVADVSHPKQALTHYAVIQEEQLQHHPVTRLQFMPITGRSHQLRVHAQFLGHPIVGDTLYATEEGIKVSERLCLHAEAICFAHPKTNQVVTYISQCPF